MKIELVIYLYTIIMTISLTILWLYHTKKNNKLDLPNHRSSHQISVPRGGGLAIAATFISVIIFTFSFTTSIFNAAITSLPFLIISLTGYFDDLLDLPWKKKLVLQILSVLPLLANIPSNLFLQAGIGYDQVLEIPYFILLPVLTIALLWTINLTNFMDGINGILICEVLFICFSSIIFRDYLMLNSIQVKMIAVLLISCLVFLPFNFPIAKIFLGDVGSLFLGMCIAWICIIYCFQSQRGIYAIIILFAMFWLDASITIIHRLLMGKQIFEAHRTHIYQTLANDFFKSHAKTTILITFINIIWLLPLAYLSLTTQYSTIIMLVAITPIMILYIAIRKKIYSMPNGF